MARNMIEALFRVRSGDDGEADENQPPRPPVSEEHPGFSTPANPRLAMADGHHKALSKRKNLQSSRRMSSESEVVTTAAPAAQAAEVSDEPMEDVPEEEAAAAPSPHPAKPQRAPRLPPKKRYADPAGALRHTAPPIPAATGTLGSSDVAPNLEGILGLQLTFDSLYELRKRLRSGSFATVFICAHNLSHEEFAVKVIDRTKLKPKDDAAVYREVSILRSLHGYDGVINLIDFFETPPTFHVILELARGGDVFDRLAKRHVYTEKIARDLAKRLLESVQYVHSCGIVHRDLKPENLLLIDELDDTLIKIADFGFAKRVDDGGPKGLVTRCGTPAFVAPEILLGVPYNQNCDMWSVGVILYLLLGGYPPFQAENQRALFRKIRGADYVFHDKYWGHVSIEVKQLIASLLVVDPEARLTASEALQTAWIKTDDETLSGSDLSASLTEIKKFNARRKMKAAVHAVAWAATATFWSADTVSFSRETMCSTVAATPTGGAGSAKSSATKKTAAAANGRGSTKAKGQTFRDVYELTKKLRSGSYATVWEGRHLATGNKYAVKVVSRRELEPKDDAQVLNEVAILHSLRHKCIVQLLDFFEEPDYFFMVMELCDGGDVFDRIVERKHYTEKDARDLAWSLLKAVQYMHGNGVAHRDLKPQNLLLQSKDNDADIKVADFGFARRVHTPLSLTTRCGTPTYVAPEILKNHPHDESADMWSVGVIIYVLLVGYPPFMEENQRALFRNIRSGDYEFYEEDWKNVSVEAKDLIKALLVVDPLQRMTAREALRTEWICGDNDDALLSRDLSGSLSEIRKTFGRTKLKGTMRAVQWMTSPCIV